MEFLLVFVLFAVGLVLIVKGGDMFVDASSLIAEMLGMPKFLIGATIVSFATTMPEMLVSLMAAFDGHAEIAVGNAIGSVTANTGLIMAVSIMFMPGRVERRMYVPKALMLIAAIISLWLLCAKGSLSSSNALILFVIIIMYVIENIQSGRKKFSKKTMGFISKKGISVQIVYFVIGAAAVIMGSRLLVDNGIIIAHILKVPENVIAITIVAVGTSLPELVTAITSIVKKEASLTAGNIIGANIIDTALILPLCSMLNGGSFPISAQTILLDIPVCLIVVAICLVPMLIFGKFKRSQGILALGTYMAYIYIACFALPFH